ncbi:hypothetical protein AMELA_G00128490 [Ameiurus melas]|uniref:Uncharacterized protein n=1 Tax=Ameiurus melas TaxID=219545 RepID=A0A7J6AQN4_AMEME|nr:hypothetical protein AMELA_G00128490 [Ameiurus melas]
MLATSLSVSIDLQIRTASNASSYSPVFHVGQLTESRLPLALCEVGWSSGEAVEHWISANMAQTNSVSQNSNGEMDDSPNTLVYRKVRPRTQCLTLRTCYV